MTEPSSTKAADQDLHQDEDDIINDSDEETNTN